MIMIDIRSRPLSTRRVFGNFDVVKAVDYAFIIRAFQVVSFIFVPNVSTYCSAPNTFGKLSWTEVGAGRE